MPSVVPLGCLDTGERLRRSCACLVLCVVHAIARLGEHLGGC